MHETSGRDVNGGQRAEDAVSSASFDCRVSSNRVGDSSVHDQTMTVIAFGER
jgi:hypothetical protein